MTFIRAAVLASFSVLVLSTAAFAADPPWRIASADGTAALTFGVLAQPQLESVTTADGADTAKHFLLRRTRLILGAKLGERISFFIDTDAPNVGKPNAAGRKGEDAMFLQDVALTYAVTRSINLEGGLIIVPVGRHATQSAAALLGVDYGPFSFSHSEPTNCRMGRDYGAQARGYLAGNHVEFRAGVFNGARGAADTAPLRFTARGVWYPFEAETGLFYTGTTLGTRRILSVGASVDHQGGYTATGADVFVDQPLSGGSRSLTGQVNYTHYNGGASLGALPHQEVWLVEAGMYDKATRLGPFAQLTTRRLSAASAAASDESKVTGGLAYWAQGHRFNVKLGIGRSTRTGAPSRTQVVLQGQLYVF
ncbi:MAG: hypothetical protein EHM24_17015 [Acidobacteria bacterium]|nr:MAG: hypothetical protein EHM24_17015 [Acidobacteriota bacterium]